MARMTLDAKAEKRKPQQNICTCGVLRVFVALIIQQTGKTQKYMSSYIHLCVNDTDLSSQFQINHIFGKKKPTLNTTLCLLLPHARQNTWKIFWDWHEWPLKQCRGRRMPASCQQSLGSLGVTWHPIFPEWRQSWRLRFHLQRRSSIMRPVCTDLLTLLLSYRSTTAHG